MVKLDKAIRALFAANPDTFVATRNTLVARLKQDGDMTAANQVKALRRPTVAAWAIDRVSSDHHSELAELVRLGEAVGAAQHEAAAGGGLDRFRAATEERRALIDRLVRAAADALGRAEMAAPRATLDRVADTLTAMASDPELAERVLNGELEKEAPAPAGFGDQRLDATLLASVSELPRPVVNAGTATPQQERKERERLRKTARLVAEATALEAEADRLMKAAKEAEAQAATAGKSAAAAKRKADAARRRAEKLAD